eukprot:11292578-Ditylum_brightwellii.AAC.1
MTQSSKAEKTYSPIKPLGDTASSGIFNTYYLTKCYDGLHPDLGGHPTDTAPFAGQPDGGSLHHCPLGHDGQAIQACPKIKPTLTMVPVDQDLAVGCDGLVANLEDLFHHERYGCCIIPDVLFYLIRKYFPCTKGELVDYPPPFTSEGGDFEFEFPSGRSFDNQEPPYKPGPPHWCTQEYLDGGNWPDICLYVFEGHDAGKYRHPHIVYAALEVYVAKLAMPNLCGVMWLGNDPDFLDPDRVPKNIAFPKMDSDKGNNRRSIARWLGQPVIPYEYP